MSAGELRQIVALATQAPSIQNTQPWRWHASGAVLDLYADRSRGLPHADAAGRQLLTSCGTALLFARVALRAAGREARWELLPDRLDHDHLARLVIGGEHPAEPAELRFAQAIATCATGPDPFEDRRLPAELRHQLSADAAAEGGWLRWIDSAAERTETATLTSRAGRIRAADQAYLGELGRWREAGDADGPRPAPAQQPELAVVGTDHEGPANWLLAGQAAGRVLLRLTVAGATAAPVDPVLDLPWAREQLRSRLELAGFAQLLLRLGYPTRSPVLPPRRALDDVLKIDAPV
jgi:hypothetical protein